MKKKTKILLSMAAAVFVLLVGCGIWWLSPTRFLSRIKNEDIAAIVVFNGNDGNRFTVDDRENIHLIAEQVRAIPMKKERIALGMGTTYHLSFLDENGKEMEKFIIMSPDNIRSGMIFYACSGELQQTEEYLIALEREQFPDTEWVQKQG